MSSDVALPIKLVPALPPIAQNRGSDSFRQCHAVIRYSFPVSVLFPAKPDVHCAGLFELPGGKLGACIREPPKYGLVSL
jgi:hypothetical protein